MKSEDFSRIMRNRKGNIFLEIMIVIVILLSLAFFFPLFAEVNDGLNEGIQNTAVLTNQSKAITAHYESNYDSIWNNAFLGILIGYALAAVISAFFIDTHPVFFIIVLILLPILTLGSMYVANIYDDYMIAFPEQEANFPFIVWIMNHFPVYIISIFALIAVVLYGKKVIT